MLYLTGDPSEIQKYHAWKTPLHVHDRFSLTRSNPAGVFSNDISPNARIIRRFSGQDVATAGITVHRGIMEKGNRRLPIGEDERVFPES